MSLGANKTKANILGVLTIISMIVFSNIIRDYLVKSVVRVKWA